MAPPMAADPFDIAGRVIWVTGSSRGVGRGIAEHLAAHGATVVVHARSAGALDDVCAALGSAAVAVVADVRDADALATAAALIDERLGRLDGVVANVGGAAFGPADTIGIE